VVFRDELERLAAAPNVRVLYMVGERREGRRGDPLRRSELRQLVPDVATREVFVCGPPGMTSAVVESLARLGVSDDQVHTEAFRL
jgi:ferredoxin-NADP reductase